MYFCCGITEQGIMPHNEDALMIAGSVRDSGASAEYVKAPFIAAVSDGVSGESAGEIASMTCLNLLRDVNYNADTDLKDALLGIHRTLTEQGSKNRETENMQATLCGVAIDEYDMVHPFNVGDSRVYLFRAGRLRQITRDQTLVQLLYEEGSITLEEKKTHVHRNIIFPAIGNMKSTPQVDFFPMDGGLLYGDMLLICTDGLSDHLSSYDIEEVLELPKSLPERLNMLVKMSLARGCNDNISVIAIVYCEDK